jgi:hypothetical protein
VAVRRNDVDPIIGDAVGSQLKALFDEFARDTVPDRFVELIERLEAVEAAEAARKNDTPDDLTDQDTSE